MILTSDLNNIGNRRIELEPDDFQKSDSFWQNQTQFSNEFIKFVNDNEIGGYGLIPKFQEKASSNGRKKQKKKNGFYPIELKELQLLLN